MPTLTRLITIPAMHGMPSLGRIRISTPDSTLQRIFYTALYHSMLAPTIYCDCDGSYIGPDGKEHRADGFTNYSSFSTWDTYRASHPLYTIIAPDRAGDMARSLTEFALQNGRLLVWNMWGSETDMMIGYHSAPIIVDAIIKNLGNIDAAKALDIMVATARNRSYRQAWRLYGPRFCTRRGGTELGDVKDSRICL